MQVLLIMLMDVNGNPNADFNALANKTKNSFAKLEISQYLREQPTVPQVLQDDKKYTATKKYENKYHPIE